MKQIIIDMIYVRSTEKTHVYVVSVNDNAPIPVIRIKQDALPSKAPSNIQVMVSYDN